MLANVNGRPKPFMQTWLLLKTNNRSSHYKDLKQSYSKIAKAIKISESTLRNHIKQMVYEGFATIDNNSLRLVSIWRNPIRYKTREYTLGHYGKIKKATINPLNLKLEVFQYKLKQQITRQNYKEKEKSKLLGRKPKDRVKEIKVELLTDVFENGSTGRKMIEIQQNAMIPLSQKDDVYERSRKGLNIVCEALACKLAMNEKNLISKSSQLSLQRLGEITGYTSSTSLRMYRAALKANSGLYEEKAVSLPLKDKKFSLKYHYKDKFGNIFRKVTIRYHVDTKDMIGEIKVRGNRGSNIPCI
jgi:hypothetical protein